MIRHILWKKNNVVFANRFYRFEPIAEIQCRKKKKKQKFCILYMHVYTLRDIAPTSRYPTNIWTTNLLNL